MKNKKYIFLDRDGTINVERKDYVKNFGEFVFLDRAITALKKLADHEFNIIIITNQSPVGRKIITSGQLDLIHSKMRDKLLEYGIPILDIFYCPSIPEANDRNRKPNPGMLFDASKKYAIDLSKTYMVGDNLSDIEAGQNAGCKYILLKHNYDLLDAVIKILEN